jgi:hypothetical protein
MPVAKGKAGMETEMRKFKNHSLHSGSATGPLVKNRAQAIAISLRESGLSKNRKKK